MSRTILTQDQMQARRGAMLAVRLAVMEGYLVRPRFCPECGGDGQLRIHRIEAHHHNGYEPHHWLDIVWLCAQCHVRVHHPLSDWRSGRLEAGLSVEELSERTGLGVDVINEIESGRCLTPDEAVALLAVFDEAGVR